MKRRETATETQKKTCSKTEKNIAGGEKERESVQESIPKFSVFAFLSYLTSWFVKIK